MKWRGITSVNSTIHIQALTENGINVPIHIWIYGQPNQQQFIEDVRVCRELILNTHDHISQYVPTGHKILIEILFKLNEKIYSQYGHHWFLGNDLISHSVRFYAICMVWWWFVTEIQLNFVFDIQPEQTVKCVCIDICAWVLCHIPVNVSDHEVPSLISHQSIHLITVSSENRRPLMGK